MLRLIGGPRVPGPRDWLIAAAILGAIVAYAALADIRVAG